MAVSYTIRIVPADVTREVRAGVEMMDLLFDLGVEFPCGGRGSCGGCRVRVRTGDAPVSDEDRMRLSPAQIRDGWRLACRLKVAADLTIEVPGWEMDVLTASELAGASGGHGLGIAIDLGTTTVAGQAIDLETGRILASRTALNAQARFGADIMSRVGRGVEPGGLQELTAVIRRQLGGMAGHLHVEAARALGRGGDFVVEGIVVVGNTVMHHLFCGLSVEPLSRYPFETEEGGERVFASSELGWALPGDPPVVFPGCLGGFVGSDILAGIFACHLMDAGGPRVLIDLGTNGEIVVARDGKMLCASTAAGPAFEGARIRNGMRATRGAIDHVMLQEGVVRCHVLGGGEATGLCGSGLVDAVACALDVGAVQPSGRILEGGGAFRLAGDICLSQQDIREVQLAKAAISAGLNILCHRMGMKAAEVEQLYLAGAFGNYIHLDSARRIGLITREIVSVRPVGNGALHGAKGALLGLSDPGIKDRIEEIRRSCEHISLSSDMEFMERFTEDMGFPGPNGDGQERNQE